MKSVFYNFRVSKTAISTDLLALNFDFGKFQPKRIVKIHQNQKPLICQNGCTSNISEIDFTKFFQTYPRLCGLLDGALETVLLEIKAAAVFNLFLS